MFKLFGDFLFFINGYAGLADWATFIVALSALLYSIKEYLLKRRPYIDIDIEIVENPDKQQGGLLFYGNLKNKGNYPGIVRVSKTEIRIGDEIYPSEVKDKMFLFPGDSKKSALIGSIYKKGINKIVGHEYKLNRAEIEIEVESGEIDSKKLKYITRMIYQINFNEGKINLTLIKENFK